MTNDIANAPRFSSDAVSPNIFPPNGDIESFSSQALVGPLDDDVYVRIHDLARHAPLVGFWLADLGTGLVRWTPNTFRLHGMAVSDGPVAVPEMMKCYHPDEKAQLFDIFEFMARERTGCSCSVRMSPLDRETYDRVRLEAGFVSGAQEHVAGQIIGAIGASDDAITYIRPVETRPLRHRDHEAQPFLHRFSRSTDLVPHD